MKRITFRGVLQSAFRTLVDLDLVSLRTVRELARRPGTLARAYMEGERARVMNPVKFAFLASTFYVLVNALTVGGETEAVLDPLMSLRWFWPYLALVLLLPTAAVQRFLFRRQSFNAAECYAFELFIFGELALAGSILLGIQRVSTIAVPVWLGLGAAGIYWSWAIADLYRDMRVSMWLRGLFVFGSFGAALTGVLYAVQWYRFSGLN